MVANFASIVALVLGDRRARGPLPPRRRGAAAATAVAGARARSPRSALNLPRWFVGDGPILLLLAVAAGADRRSRSRSCGTGSSTSGSSSPARCSTSAQPRGRRGVHRPGRRPRRDPARRRRPGARHAVDRARLQPGAGPAAAGGRPAVLRVALGPGTRGVPGRRATGGDRRPRRRSGRGTATRSGCRSPRSGGTAARSPPRANRPAVLHAVALAFRGERVGELVSACGAGRTPARPGRPRASLRAARGAARRGAARHRAGRGAAGRPGSGIVERPRGGAPAAAPRPARRARSDADRRRVQGGRRRATCSPPTRPRPRAADRRRCAPTSGSAIDDVRRVVYELRPPALDELGPGRRAAPARRRAAAGGSPWTRPRDRCPRCPPRSRWPPTGSPPRR